MNYLQKQATLHKIAQIKRAAKALLILKSASDRAVDISLDNIDPSPDVCNDLEGISNYKLPGIKSLLGAGSGAALGGIAGALTSDDEELRLRNAIIGALTGTAVGGLGGYGIEHVGRLSDYENAIRKQRYDMDSKKV